MDKELKIVTGVYVFLLLVAAALLYALAGISPLSLGFAGAYFPFAIYLFLYIFLGSNAFVAGFQSFLQGRRERYFIFPVALLGVIILANVAMGIAHVVLFAKTAAWLFAPVVLLAFSQNLWAFLAAAIALWMPIELGWLAGLDLVFRPDITIPALPFLAPALGLYSFLVVGKLPGIGHSFRIHLRDLWPVVLGLFALVCLLVPLGTHSAFIRYAPEKVSFGHFCELLFGIYFLVALPEELLFRGLFQNIFMQMLGPSKLGRAAALSAAAFLFGLAHWNNFNPPDWRYVWLATVAGLVYGSVYMKTGKTTVSAMVHCGVNLTWAIIFPGTGG